MTLLSTLKDKRIVVLGAGLTGLSCARYLHAQGLSFTVNDSREKPFAAGQYSESNFQQDFSHAKLVTGCWCQESIALADLIIASPGIDLHSSGIHSWINDSCQVIGDVELFCQVNNARVNPMAILAVTGSNGKSTVVSMLAYLAKVLGENAQLGGNIGQPVLDLLMPEQATDMVHSSQPDLVILELSSFQLETMNSMKAIAASVLNLSDDHLDRHKTMANYQAIKQRIYPQAKIAVINRDDQATVTLDSSQQMISFGSDKPTVGNFGVAGEAGEQALRFGEQMLIPLDKLPLAGMHNALNYLAVLALGYSAGWSLSAMVENLKGFSGLAHRCQLIETNDDIAWINDSKATNVGATLAAINGLSQTKAADSQLILILGGEGKGADFSPLSKAINESGAQVIALGKDGSQIVELLGGTLVESLDDAVAKAHELATAGDMVLLSPACASIDMFKNYMERGDKYIALVHAVAGGA
ncbi:UDP-N-acetylmuramoyl-L-alanine--D-glutamate ligase [Litorilituus sediminis]|uniref:UDP-N-acetylmuramoylalanine--D-glutamate ligase n=1 Tax=Litorilituus sediminis TaxID=718192 RepID=A0A4V0ZGC1_9GAMM|nr:UDP-N-acetylmuramoyl-L-alanine--D-glutamate ligase [Litorilituus sediminis]QBG36780.1 UDP-N-acetylmuramoyl-L-alanine--D-glutamate ligase [Litorilituus sediminis]